MDINVLNLVESDTILALGYVDSIIAESPDPSPDEEHEVTMAEATEREERPHVQTPTDTPESGVKAPEYLQYGKVPRSLTGQRFPRRQSKDQWTARPMVAPMNIVKRSQGLETCTVPVSLKDYRTGTRNAVCDQPSSVPRHREVSIHPGSRQYQSLLGTREMMPLLNTLVEVWKITSGRSLPSIDKFPLCFPLGLFCGQDSLATPVYSVDSIIAESPDSSPDEEHEVTMAEATEREERPHVQTPTDTPESGVKAPEYLQYGKVPRSLNRPEIPQTSEVPVSLKDYRTGTRNAVCDQPSSVPRHREVSIHPGSRQYQSLLGTREMMPLLNTLVEVWKITSGRSLPSIDKFPLCFPLGLFCGQDSLATPVYSETCLLYEVYVKQTLLTRQVPTCPSAKYPPAPRPSSHLPLGQVPTCPSAKYPPAPRPRTHLPLGQVPTCPSAKYPPAPRPSTHLPLGQVPTCPSAKYPPAPRPSTHLPLGQVPTCPSAKYPPAPRPSTHLPLGEVPTCPSAKYPPAPRSSTHLPLGQVPTCPSAKYPPAPRPSTHLPLGLVPTCPSAKYPPAPRPSTHLPLGQVPTCSLVKYPPAPQPTTHLPLRQVPTCPFAKYPPAP
ncbi:uncharacterized protein [Procambarus clarkii]|uniref:uncharacterized protein n=1 Tax=Procambarus clarkii TaxID=6728 RepID=UPI0037420701